MLRTLPLCFALLVFGCSAPVDAPKPSADPAPAACTLEGTPLLDLARAYEQADLVVRARTLRVLPASQFVQSPPPAPGDTARFIVTGEVMAVAYGPSALGERVDYVVAMPFAPDWEKHWTEGSEWTAWLAPREGRVPWKAVRAPLSASAPMDTLLTADVWPPAGLRFAPGIAVESVAGGVPAASGYVFSLKAASGMSVRLRLTDLAAEAPQLWAQPAGAPIWEHITPCSLAGARLHLALPSPEAARLSGVEADAAYARLAGLLGEAHGA